MGAGCLAALTVLCGALGDAPGRGKSPISAPTGDTATAWASVVPGEERADCGCCSGSGCDQVPGRGTCFPQLGLGEGAGICSHHVRQQVRGTAPCLFCCFTLVLLKIAGRGCPFVVYRCFAEGFLN